MLSQPSFRLVTQPFVPPSFCIRSRPVSSLICVSCSAHRRLSTSPYLLKKGGGKQEQKRTVELNASKTAGRDDAHDFSGFHQEIDKAVNFLKRELSKLKAGGLDLEAIESLKVNISPRGGSGGGGPKKDGSRSGRQEKEEVVKVGDVAQVVPRGRIVVIMVGEKDVCSDCFLCISCSLRFIHPYSNHREQHHRLMRNSTLNLRHALYNPHQ